MVLATSRAVQDTGEYSIVDLLGSSYEALGHAVALVDVESDRLLWCSSYWCQRLPLLSCQQASNLDSAQSLNINHASVSPEARHALSWSQALAQSPEVAQVFDKALIDASASGQVKDAISGGFAKLDVRQLQSTQYVLQLQSETRAVDDMHQYMQAREHLFTTSRTISVSEMATTLAHEIRQPIATISNILKGVKMRLARSDSADSKLEEALDKALGQAQFTDSIISRIRDFTEARRPKQQSVEICSVLRESVELMDWLFSNNQCRVSLELPKQQFFCDGESVRIEIHDHGHGLEGKENSLFVPFATSKSDGMGVGLNICRSFVELHQGRLWLAPNPDGGCTSHVELPLSEESLTHQKEIEGSENE